MRCPVRIKSPHSVDDPIDPQPVVEGTIGVIKVYYLILYLLWTDAILSECWNLNDRLCDLQSF